MKAKTTKWRNEGQGQNSLGTVNQGPECHFVIY